MSESSKSETAPGGDRLAKVIARAGLCSRRDAEKWIADGRVSVDGEVVRTPATNVTDEMIVAVDGAPLAARLGTRLWLYHKPPGLVVTEKDPEGRPTIFEKLTEMGLPRVVTVGRLDINTEGLLLLTNDGGLKRVLELPATGWLRKYRVRAYGSIDQGRLDTLKTGMTVDGVTYGPIEAILERVQGGNVWLVVALREGKNREVKNVLGALGLTVNRLIRISYGPFQLGDLAVGAVTAVKSKVLRDQLGERLARQAGVDFDSAITEDAVPEKRQDTGQKAKNPNDPNARLRARPVRPAKPQAAPKPRTGEPRFAKKRATEKVPPARFGRDGVEEKPIKRRVLFDDGSKLIEEVPRPRRDKFDADAPPRRDRPDAPRGRSDAPRGRDDGPRGRADGPRGRADGDRKSCGARSGDRPGDRGRSDGDRKSFGARSGDRPGDRGRSDGDRKSYGARSGDRPADRSGDRPQRGGRPDTRGAGRPESRGSGKPPGHGADRSGPRGTGKPAGPRGAGKPAGPRGTGKPSGPRGAGKPAGPRGAGKPAGPRSRGPRS